MNLEELRSVQDAERQRSDLQPLRESFYEEAGEYIAGLKEDRDRAAAEAEDPFSSAEVRRLTDEIETAEEVVEAVYERRLGKLVERASLAASDMAVDENGLTNEEQALFHDLVERMKDSKRTVLDTLDPEVDTASRADPPERSSDAGTTDGATGPDTTGDPGAARGADSDPDPHRGSPTDSRQSGGGPTDDGVSAADLMGADEASETTADGGTATRGPPAGGSDPARRNGHDPTDDGRGQATGERGDARAGGGPTTNGTAGEVSGSSTDRVTVRITRDVGEILGVDDRQYDLTAEDVVQLPARNADPLVERGAAERLD